MRPALHPGAERDLADAARWYEEQQSGLGDRFVSAVVDCIRAIEAHPARFPKIPNADGPVRKCLLARFPYAVMFEYDEHTGTTIILAIAHARRRPGYWRGRRP